MLFRVRVDLHTYLHRILVTSGDDVYVWWNTNCAKNTQGTENRLVIMITVE